MTTTNEKMYRSEQVERFDYLGVIFAAEPNSKEEIPNRMMWYMR